MTEPEEWGKVANEPLPMEPKEEPLYDFILMSADIEEKASNKSALVLKQPKEESLDPSFSSKTELIFMGDKECKKEEMLDYDILPDNAEDTNRKSEETDIATPFPVEPKLEVLEDRVVIAVENPNGLRFFDDFKDEAMLADNKIHHRVRKSNDEKLASSSGLPFPANDIVETNNLRFNIDIQDLFDKSSTTPPCIHCEKSPSTIHAYANHIRAHHNSTLTQNEIFLRCSCGLEVHSTYRDPTHSEKCDGIHFSVLKVDKKIPSTPKCILCEKYPPTVYAYAGHLYHQHKSSLLEKDIFLRCSCGLEVHSTHRNPAHMEKCAGIHFSVLKIDKTIPSTPKCLLCEKYPSTIFAYAYHLFDQHKSSLTKNGIFLRCSCGQEVRSSDHDSSHIEKCSGSNFSLKSKKKMIAATVKCILCEKYPSTAYSYAWHIANQHKSSLNTQGIYLQCSCGEKIRGTSLSSRHINGCDARQFTVERDVLQILQENSNLARITQCVVSDHCYALPPH